MDINIVRGIILILLIAGFIGLAYWAFSSRRKADFESMARLPLEEDWKNLKAVGDTNPERGEVEED